jgi:hypothetical protein
MREKHKVRDSLTATVYGPDGKIKTRPQNWLQKLLRLTPKLMVGKSRRK